MLKSYVVELETRVRIIQDLLGNPTNFDTDSKQCKEKLDEVISKISTNKDLFRKYQKINSFVEKHASLLDGMYTGDKVSIVIDELDSLNEIAETLNQIEKMLPSLDTDTYVENVRKFDNLDILETVSEVKIGQQGVEIVKYNPTSLQNLREQEQKEMNALMELNYRMINNLNSKIKLAYQNKMTKI